ncbi:hypothetical protein [Bosea sp. 117]|uniref:hypothetical protein n=1 Tax=Bosea sp. 117 TaxID=1125973 RepID=UPI000493D144|nr:hypothetical protein [Bosea sp. 117]
MARASKTAGGQESGAGPRIREVERTNAALRAGGLGYQVGPNGPFDAEAFADAALKRWPRVMAKLGE